MYSHSSKEFTHTVSMLRTTELVKKISSMERAHSSELAQIQANRDGFELAKLGRIIEKRKKYHDSPRSDSHISESLIHTHSISRIHPFLV